MRLSNVMRTLAVWVVVCAATAQAPVVGEIDWMLTAYIALKVFVWLCPAEVVREHVGQIAHGQ